MGQPPRRRGSVLRGPGCGRGPKACPFSLHPFLSADYRQSLPAVPARLAVISDSACPLAIPPARTDAFAAAPPPLFLFFLNTRAKTDTHTQQQQNQATKVPLTSAERRISLLYATHELFKRASKDPDMDFDYAAWHDAVKALVPWTIRKQSEADRIKINKSVSLGEEAGKTRVVCGLLGSTERERNLVRYGGRVSCVAASARTTL